MSCLCAALLALVLPFLLPNLLPVFCSCAVCHALRAAVGMLCGLLACKRLDDEVLVHLHQLLLHFTARVSPLLMQE